MRVSKQGNGCKKRYDAHLLDAMLCASLVSGFRFVPEPVDDLVANMEMLLAASEVHTVRPAA